MILEVRRLKVWEIAETVGMASKQVYHILRVNEELGMIKLSARWVLWLLSQDQKRIRVEISEKCLAHFQRNQSDFFNWFVTTDETWVHYYTPETKLQSKQCKHVDSPQPKKAKAIQSARKVMESVFWDSIDRLSSNWSNNCRTILCWPPGPIIAKDTCFSKEQSHVPSGQHMLTHVSLPWQKWTNWGTNCCHTHLIVWYGSIKLPLFPKLKIFLGGRDSLQTKN